MIIPCPNMLAILPNNYRIYPISTVDDCFLQDCQGTQISARMPRFRTRGELAILQGEGERNEADIRS